MRQKGYHNDDITTRIKLLFEPVFPLGVLNIQLQYVKLFIQVGLIKNQQLPSSLLENNEWSLSTTF